MAQETDPSEFDINLDAESTDAPEEEDQREAQNERFIGGLGRSVLRLIPFHTQEGVFRTINERLYRKVGLIKANGKLLEIPWMPKEIDPVAKAKYEIKDALIRAGKAVDDKSVWKHPLLKRCYDDIRPWGAAILYEDSSICSGCHNFAQVRVTCEFCGGKGVIDAERAKRDPYVVGEIYIVRLDMGKPKMAQLIEDWVKQPGNDPTHIRTGYPVAIVGTKDSRNKYNNYSLEPLREYRANAGVFNVRGQISKKQAIDIEILNFYKEGPQAGDAELKKRIKRAHELQLHLGSRKLLKELTTGPDAERRRKEIYDYLKMELQRVIDGTSSGDLPQAGESAPNANTQQAQTQSQQAQSNTTTSATAPVTAEPKNVSQVRAEEAKLPPVSTPSGEASQVNYPLAGEPVLLSDFPNTTPPPGRPVVLDDGFVLEKRDPKNCDSKGVPRCFGLLPVITAPECMLCPSTTKNRCVVAKFKRDKATKESAPST